MNISCDNGKMLPHLSREEVKFRNRLIKHNIRVQTTAYLTE